jgi:DNA (cytosine-5)-methyltransferase 1
LVSQFKHSSRLNHDSAQKMILKNSQASRQSGSSKSRPHQRNGTPWETNFSPHLNSHLAIGDARPSEYPLPEWSAPRTHSIPFVDLFCGAGGLSVGFERAGFRSVYAIDNDESAVETYSFNHPGAAVECVDIAEISADSIRCASGLDSIPLVIGGPNCQGVSLRGKRDPNDPKNKAFYNFVRIISELQPDWFVMENVPGLLHRHNRNLAADILREFKEIGYDCGADVLLAADYGVPQLRYRLFLVGNRVGAPIFFPSPTHSCPLEKLGLQDSIFCFVSPHKPQWTTVRDAIGDLPPLENGGGEEALFDYFSKTRFTTPSFAGWCNAGYPHLTNHVCHRTNDRNIRLIRHIPPGKNWKAIPQHLRPERFSRVALKDHTTTYGRLDWGMPARTITTYFNNITSGAFTHPGQHRGISIREGARLQSFPDVFRFLGTTARQYRQVGNAVPCRLAFHVAEVISKLMTSRWSRDDSLLRPAVELSRHGGILQFNRPLRGMRFNLDKYLVLD